MLGPVNQNDPSEEVLEAARERAAALASGDRERLGKLLHPQFRWISHAGESFDHDSYLDSNTTGDLHWTGQEMNKVHVVMHERTAVLRCQVVDRFDRGHGPEEFEMPMTQVWVRHDDGRWVCLAGHAGPRTA
jgi:hypothetical protein